MAGLPGKDCKPLNNRTNLERKAEYLVGLASLVTTVGLLLWLMSWARRGFDFTDEGFLLNWIAFAPYYDTSHIQVGYLLHPLYQLLDGSIVGLRWLNILLLFSAGMTFGYVLLRAMRARGASGEASSKPEGVMVAAVAAATGAGVFLLFENWLLVPGYYSMNLVAVCLFATSLLLISSAERRGTNFGWVLLAIAGWLSFISRVSTAAFLPLLALAFLLSRRRINPGGMVLAFVIVMGLLLATAFFIDGSVVIFIERIRRALEFSQMMGESRSMAGIFHLDEFNLRNWDIYEILIIAAYVAGTTGLLGSRKPAVRWIGIGSIIVGLALTWLAMMNIVILDFRMTRLEEAKHLGVLLGAGITVFLPGRQKSDTGEPGISVPIIVLLLCLPLVYVIGTNVNLWEASFRGGIFYAAAGLALLGRYGLFRPAVLLPAAIALQLSTVAVLAEEIRRPYRQPSLYAATETVELGVHGAELLVPQRTKRYIVEMRGLLEQSGFTPGTPVIDLTGQYPGILYAAGAFPVGQPWLVGGCGGCTERAVAALSRVSCTVRAEAWLLTGPEGVRRIPLNILPRIGLDIDNYATIGEILSPERRGVAASRQIVFKPSGSEAQHLEQCITGSTEGQETVIHENGDVS